MAHSSTRHADEREPREERPAAAASRFRLFYALAGAALLALASGFAALVAAHPSRPLTLRIDRGWQAIIGHIRDPALTEGAKIVSLVGGRVGGTVIVIAVAAFLWLVRERRVGATYLAAVLVVSSSASQLIKHLVLRSRPLGALITADVGSFPSGHVVTTLAVGSALALVLARPGHRRIPLAVVAVATLTMIWCRSYLGVHWLSDTLESIFVAGGIVLTGWAFAGRWVDREVSSRP